MKLLHCSILLLLGISNYFPQTPSVEWEKTIGGTGNDRAYCIKNTTDHGYIVVGNTTSFGEGQSDVYLVKLDSLGNTMWAKTVGGEGGDIGNSIQLTNDGGYIILGTTGSFGQSTQFYLVRTDENGDTIWTRTYGGLNQDFGYSIEKTSDSCFVLCGETQSYGNIDGNAYIIKINSIGDTIWTRVIPGDIRYDHSIQQTSDGGYIIASCLYDIILTKTDGSGNTIWSKSYGGWNMEYGGCVRQTFDGGYIIAGESNSFSSNNDYNYLIIKTDENGNTIWTKSFGAGFSDNPHYVIQTHEGRYAVIGELQSYGIGFVSFYLVGLDANGNTAFSGFYGGESVDVGQSIQETDNGNFIICGYTTSFGAGQEDMYIIKTGKILVNVEDLKQPYQFWLDQNYPNPFNPSTKIYWTMASKDRVLIVVYDILGRKIKTLVNDERPAGEYEVIFDGTDLSTGIYFYTINAGSYIKTRKMMLLK